MIQHIQIVSLAAALLIAPPAFAGNAGMSAVTAPVVNRLEANGCAVTGVRRSWLGRIVITCNAGGELREVVLNRTSGAVLSDQLFDTSDTESTAPDEADPTTQPETDGPGNGPSPKPGNGRG